MTIIFILYSGAVERDIYWDVERNEKLTDKLKLGRKTKGNVTQSEGNSRE